LCIGRRRDDAEQYSGGQTELVHCSHHIGHICSDIIDSLRSMVLLHKMVTPKQAFLFR
jgi:hypothetical protein